MHAMLSQYRDAKKVDKHLYHKLYMLCKGNQYKNKRVLMEAIHKMKAETIRERALVEQVRIHHTTCWFVARLCIVAFSLSVLRGIERKYGGLIHLDSFEISVDILSAQLCLGWQ